MYRQKTIEISAYHSPLLNVKEKALIITTDQLFDSLGLCALIEYIRNQGKNISSTLQCNIYKHISENRFHEESKDCSGKNIFTRQIVCVYTCTNIPASSSYIVVCSNKMQIVISMVTCGCLLVQNLFLMYRFLPLQLRTSNAFISEEMIGIYYANKII